MESVSVIDDEKEAIMASNQNSTVRKRRYGGGRPRDIPRTMSEQANRDALDRGDPSAPIRKPARHNADYEPESRLM